MEAALVRPEPASAAAIEFLHEPVPDLPEELALRVDAEVLVVHEEMGQQVELVGHIRLRSVAFDGAFGVLVVDIAAVGDGGVGRFDEVPDVRSGPPVDGTIQVRPAGLSRHRGGRGSQPVRGARRRPSAGLPPRFGWASCRRITAVTSLDSKGFEMDRHVAEFPGEV